MQHIMEYCERQGPGLREPINTLTNLVFVWAAVEAWSLAGRYRIRAWDVHYWQVWRLPLELAAESGTRLQCPGQNRWT